MNQNFEIWQSITRQAEASGARLIAVSKTKSSKQIMELYDYGQRDFGENKVQELTEKHELLPKDIRWHEIGHLQTNKVKYIAPFVHLIHAVDSLKLLREINKQAEKNDRIIPCLLQFKIASEDSKYGLDKAEALEVLQSDEYKELNHVVIHGVMGMATFTEDAGQVRKEFQTLHGIFLELQEQFFQDAPHFREISMGMSDDYPIALEEGSTLLRVGSLLFGKREYPTI